MNKVSNPITNANNGTFIKNTDVYNPQEQWVTTLFVQFRFSRSGRCVDRDCGLGQYQALLRQAISYHNGELVALASDAALALFSGSGPAQRHTRGGIESARAIMNDITEVNKERVAQDLAPVRVAIGLDAGVLRTTSCRRHPRLDPGLEQFLHRARRLSDLNYQTPFPAIFASRPVVDSLELGERHAIQNLGDVFVEGQTGRLVVYAIMDG